MFTVRLARMSLLAALALILGAAQSSAFAQNADRLDELLPGQSDAADRDPAALKSSTLKRTYPGGADDEDLRVVSQIPEAAIRTDARSVQRQVYKRLNHGKDLKDDRQETVEE
jgi:hypothetical protein